MTCGSGISRAGNSERFEDEEFFFSLMLTVNSYARAFWDTRDNITTGSFTGERFRLFFLFTRDLRSLISATFRHEFFGGDLSVMCSVGKRFLCFNHFVTTQTNMKYNI